jgi:hypothetical protein
MNDDERGSADRRLSALSINNTLGIEDPGPFFSLPASSSFLLSSVVNDFE